MAKTLKSAGLLAFRHRPSGPEFLLVHPGGPFWKNKDDGAWSIPKGLIDEGEGELAAAIREFSEETGQSIAGDFMPLTPRKQKGGKTVLCWLVEADLGLSNFRSNLCEMEWPRGSGRVISFPECDQASYFSESLATRKILAGQQPFLEEAMAYLATRKRKPQV
jgi:predicted NUDIX family NTP pyrophosphohydrolase